MQFPAFFVVMFLAVSARDLDPTAVTGSSVRQLSDSQVASIIASDTSDLDPFNELPSQIEKTRTVYFDPINDRCAGQPYKFACPGERAKMRRTGEAPICVSEEQLCDEHNDCPGGEDEHRLSCQYHVLRRGQVMAVERELSEVEGVKEDLGQLRQAIQRKKLHLRGARRANHPRRLSGLGSPLQE